VPLWFQFFALVFVGSFVSVAVRSDVVRLAIVEPTSRPFTCNGC
jgi:hypothetical protein